MDPYLRTSAASIRSQTHPVFVFNKYKRMNPIYATLSQAKVFNLKRIPI